MAAMVEGAISPSLDSDHSSTSSSLPTIEYLDYTNESNLTEIQALVSKDLSEPYSIFTYRYFLHNWPNLCICAYSSSPEKPQKEMIGTIVCKADLEYGVMKGYIAMLTVNNLYRKQGIGSYLAQLGIQRMINAGCLEIVLETEVSNKGASSLYEKLGFLREERLARYYLNGGDAFRLRLTIPPPALISEESKDDLGSPPQVEQLTEGQR